MPHKPMKNSIVIKALCLLLCVVFALFCMTGCFGKEEKQDEGKEEPGSDNISEEPGEPVVIPGLYNKTTGELMYTWEKLIEDKRVSIKGKTWTQTTSSIEGRIVVPDTISIIGAKAAYNCAGLTGVIISKSVALIEAQAFQGCTGITEVKIGENVTRIGDNAFRGCTGLKTLDMGANVTYIGNYAFEGCTAMPYLIISDSVTNIGKYAFANCTGLLDVLVGNSVTNVGNNAFELCTGIKRITFGRKVTNIGVKAMYDCGAINEINFCGSKSAWASITVGKQNPVIISGIIPVKFNVSATTIKEEIAAAMEGKTGEEAGESDTENESKDKTSK